MKLRFMAVMLACLMLVGCGGDKPSSDDFKKAVNENIQMELQQLSAITGIKFDPSELPVIKSVDNIRAKDDATYVADITFEHKKTGGKETQAVAMRKIEKKWKVVE